MEKPVLLISFGGLALCWVAVWVAVRAIRCLRTGVLNWKEELRLLLLFVYSLVLMRFTLFPYTRIRGAVQPLAIMWQSLWPPRVNVVPLVHLVDWQESTVDIVLNVGGNVALFAPLGFLLPLCWKECDSFPKVIAAGAVISCAIELLQLLVVSRVTDVDDVLLNLVGIALGYGAYLLLRRSS